MTTLQMTPSDLCDLRNLLELYTATYGTAERDSALLSEVNGRYMEQYRLVYGAEYPPEFMNSRNAGRKPLYPAEKKERIRSLYLEGGKTMRKIAAEESCSVSFVYESVHRLNTPRQTVSGD